PTTTAWLALIGTTAVHALAVILWPLTLTSATNDGSEITLTEQQSLIISVSVMLTLSMVALMLGATTRGRRLHITALVERTEQLALERDQREQIARTAERNRIAREMHDVVAH